MRKLSAEDRAIFWNTTENRWQ